MVVSVVVLLAEVGNPLRLLRIAFALSSATTSFFASFLVSLRGIALLLLALFFLFLPLCFALRLSLFFLLDLLGVFAEFVTDVLMRKVAFLRPHVIVCDAAKTKG